MIKISKIILCLLCIINLPILTSCNKDYQEFNDGLTLEISSSIKPYLVYQEDLPTLHFDYKGVRALIENEGSACFFVKNDQYTLSDKFKEHLDKIDKNNIITISEEIQKYDQGYAKFGKDTLKLDEVDEEGNAQNNSVEKQIVVFDEHGTRYSYQFRTFVSGKKRYYIYRYSSNMGISIEQPLMVHKKDGQNKLLLVALPYNTKYEVSITTIKLSALIDKDTYLDEHYFKYAYPTYLDGYDEATKISMIKDWYKTYCNGYSDNDDFYFFYLGAQFKIEFGINDAGNAHNLAGFKITFIE